MHNIAAAHEPVCHLSPDLFQRAQPTHVCPQEMFWHGASPGYLNPRLLPMLAGLPSLQQLTLIGAIPSVGRVLLQVTQLTRLALKGVGGVDAQDQLVQLKCLPKLAHLTLKWEPLSEAEISGLQDCSMLTALELLHLQRLELNAVLLPKFSQLAALRPAAGHLHVSAAMPPAAAARLQPSLLASLPQLPAALPE